MKKTKMQRGITLIALIITIVVIVILAAVTISVLSDSGIISRAKNAQTEYEIGEEKEKVTLAANEAFLSGLGTITEEDLADALDSNFGPGEYSIDSSNSEYFTVIITKSGKEYKVYKSSGEVDEPTGGTESDPVEVLGKATVGTKVEENSTIDGEIYSSTNPIIPAGFTAINTTTSNWNAASGPEVDNGLVIGDESGNEFVWVPVSDINAMIMCQEHGATEEGLDKETLQCPTCGENTKLAGKLYATTVGNNFSSTTTGQTYGKNTGFREPDVITDASGEDSTAGTKNDYQYLSTVLEGEYAKDQTVTSFKAQLQNEFNNMAKSIAKYGGFYVGRYELSLTENKTAQSKYGETSSDVSQTDTNMWYGLYNKSKTYVSTKGSVQSSMIWGSQYDAMMRWMANGDDTIVKSTISNYNKTRLTGTVSTDILKNVYDLYGNSLEWTLEAFDRSIRVYRGGYYRGGAAPSFRFWDSLAITDTSLGSRLTLYVEL